MRVMCQDRMREDKKGFLQFIAYSQVIGIIIGGSRTFIV